jgi:hypothetical protein
MSPICQGLMLTLRRALKVILSSELPRSPGPRLRAWARLSLLPVSTRSTRPRSTKRLSTGLNECLTCGCHNAPRWLSLVAQTASDRRRLRISIAYPGAKTALAEIYNAEDKRHAQAAAKTFTTNHGTKFARATTKITDDLDMLLSFYDYPAEHWIHLRTTIPIESTFATVRHRTRVTKGRGSRTAGLAVAFKLIESAQQRWRAVNAPAWSGWSAPAPPSAPASSLNVQCRRWLRELPRPRPHGGRAGRH